MVFVAKIVDTPFRVKTNCKLQLPQNKYSLHTELVHDLESQTGREILNRLKTKLDIFKSNKTNYKILITKARKYFIFYGVSPYNLVNIQINPYLHT